MSKEELQKRNAELRAEVSKLQELVNAIGEDTEEKKKAKSQQIRDTEVLHQAFKEFDLDGNGFIDKNELQALAFVLGEHWDHTEVEEALKAMDLNKDGKISFAEFEKFYMSDNSKIKDKSVAQLMVLKGKIFARYLPSSFPLLLRQLSERKVDEGVDDWVSHHISIRVGAECKDPGSTALATITFGNEPIAAFKTLECNNATYIDLVPKKDCNTEDAKKAIEEVLVKLVPTKYTVEDHKDKIRVILALPGPDPLAIQGVDLDLKKFVRKIQLSIELQQGIHALIDEDNNKGRSLASLIRGKIELDIQFRKALIYTLVDSIPQMKQNPVTARNADGFDRALILSWLEKTELIMHLGDPEQFLREMVPPEGVDPVATMRANIPLQMAQMNMFGNDAAVQFQAGLEVEIAKFEAKQKAYRYLLSDNFQKSLHDMYRSALTELLASQPSLLALTSILRKHFVEPREVAVVTASGAAAKFEFNNFAPFAYLEDIQNN